MEEKTYTLETIFSTPFNACIPYAEHVIQFLNQQQEHLGHNVNDTRNSVMPDLIARIRHKTVSYIDIINTIFRYLAGISPLIQFHDDYPSLNNLTDRISIGLRQKNRWRFEKHSLFIIQNAMRMRLEDIISSVEKNKINKIYNRPFLRRLYNRLCQNMPLVVPILCLNQTYVDIHPILSHIFNYRCVIGIKTFRKVKNVDGKLFSPLNFALHDWLHYANHLHLEIFFACCDQLTSMVNFSWFDQNWYPKQMLYINSQNFFSRYCMVSFSSIQHILQSEIEQQQHYFSFFQHLFQSIESHKKELKQSDNDYQKCLIGLFWIFHEHLIYHHHAKTPWDLSQIISQKQIFYLKTHEQSSFPVEFRNHRQNDLAYSVTIHAYDMRIKSTEHLLKTLTDYAPYPKQPRLFLLKFYTELEYCMLYHNLKPEWDHINNHMKACVDTLCDYIKTRPLA